MRKISFIEGKIYHVFNRSVEKRIIFSDDEDHFRFIHDLYEFNDEAPALNIYYKKPFPQLYETKSRKVDIERLKRERGKRKLLVKILAFALMPNHFHLLLQQIKESGISNFMHKLGVGYTIYFNQKHERSGSLFQGTYKAVAVEEESHFIHLPFYIHANPLDLTMPEWREREIEDYKKALKILESYRWSSHPDYIGKKNFPSVTQREFLLEFFGGTKGYKRSIESWLREIDLSSMKDLILE